VKLEISQQARAATEAAANLEVDFKPGSLGIELSCSSGLVTKVIDGQQADSKGVRAGMTWVRLQGEPFTKERLKTAITGNGNYNATFAKAAEEAAAKKTAEEAAVKKAAEEAAAKKATEAHTFQSFSFTKPTWCGRCSCFLWGTPLQGKLCRQCSASWCFECANSAASQTDVCVASHQAAATRQESRPALPPPRLSHCLSATSVKGTSYPSLEPLPAPAVSPSIGYVQAIAGAGVGDLQATVQSSVRERFEKLIRRSTALPYEMPTVANRLSQLCGQSQSLREEAVAHADGTRPIIHHRLISLVETFLAYKLEHGSDAEITLYQGNLSDQSSVASQIKRLLLLRPLMFTSAQDEYLLHDGHTRGFGAQDSGMPIDPSFGRFDDVGTGRQQSPLVLSNYQSYDEMLLSSLLGMSVPTRFINTGGRFNQGQLDAEGSFQAKGVVIGLVGPRFERSGMMDFQHMIVTPQQNTEENGYGAVGAKQNAMMAAWAKLYGQDHLPTYEEADEITKCGGRRFARIDAVGGFLDTSIYAARCEVIAETFLIEANERARLAGATAFCHIVCLDLDRWTLSDAQTQIQVDAYAAVVRRLALPHVGELHLSCFDNVTFCGGFGSGSSIQTLSGTPVRVVFDRREPAEALPAITPGEKPWLLVVMHPWNSNSYPGNEYWNKQLSASDAAALACCSTIPELQNPEVNSEAFAPERMCVLKIDGSEVKVEDFSCVSSA